MRDVGEYDEIERAAPDLVDDVPSCLSFVAVYNITRFAREKYDHFALRALLKSLGISLRSATEPIDDTLTGRPMEGVLAAFAQFDNDVRSDRTRGGMRAALEQGRWTFVPPLGYLNAPRWSGASLTPDPNRGPLVTKAVGASPAAWLP
jgi:DNA invertase Pin-like site-specific DNA recombinase